MSSVNDMRFRPSAAFPFALSVLSFVLVLLLILSGTRPDLVPDGYLLSFNTTNVGQKPVQFGPAVATPSAVATRDVNAPNSYEMLRSLRQRTSSLLQKRSNIVSLTTQNSNSTSSTSKSLNSTSSISQSLNTTSESPNLNLTSSSTQNLNSTSAASTSSAAPSLNIPTVASTTPSTGINIAVIGSFFQIVLNSFASGVGDTLNGVTTLLATSSKQQLDVSQIYTMHLQNICEGSVANSTDSGSSFNFTRCVSYNNASATIANFTSTISNTTTIAAMNITVPFLTEVPGLGRSTKSAIDTASGFILFFFIVNLIGSGSSIILSVVAFLSPSNTKVPLAGAAITTISTTILQTATFTSTILITTIKSSINKFSSTIGLSASAGSKFLAFIWIGYIAAQAANSYWITIWFVEYRKRSYKARERTAQEIGNYKGIKKEVWSDIRLQKGLNEYPEDAKALSGAEAAGFQSRRSYYNQI